MGAPYIYIYIYIYDISRLRVNFRRDSERDRAQPLPAGEALLVVGWRCTARLYGHVDRLQIESRYEEVFCSGGLRGGGGVWGDKS